MCSTSRKKLLSLRTRLTRAERSTRSSRAVPSRSWSGGSGLYVSSVIFDFRFPPHDDVLRASLEADLERDGPGMLFARLAELDPVTAARVDAQNGRRVVRALEIVLQGEDTHGAALPEAPTLWRDSTTIIGVHVDRSALVARLDARVDAMWAAGLLEEVRTLRERGLERGVTARRAIGYAQALAELDGELSRADAIAQAQALTRRYARRQVSWFKRYADITWYDGGASNDFSTVQAILG